MKKTLLLFLGLVSLCAYAQPTITADIIPEAGDSIHLVRCGQTDAQDNLTGANQTWDFSGLVPHPSSPEYYFKFYEPSETPHGDRYPNSFLAATAPDSQWIYYVLNADILELTGAVAEVPMFGTAFADYDNPETETVFPMELGTTWSDDFNGDNFAGGFGAPFTGSVSGEADGYGTLILPNGTYENVLRNRQERTYQLQGAPVTETSTLWIYSTPEVGLWLLSIEEFSNGGEQLVYYSDTPLIISSVSESYDDSNSLYPNPVRAGQNVYLSMPDGEIRNVKLIDFSGKEIKTFRNPDLKELALPDNLVSGIYFMQFSTKQGDFSRKISVIE